MLSSYIRPTLAKRFTFTAVSIALLNTVFGLPSNPVVASPISVKKPFSISIGELKNVAKQTWGYFVSATNNATGLPVDRIDMQESQSLPGAPELPIEKTSPTNIGLYLMSTVSAYDLGFISKADAEGRLSRCLKTLVALPKWNGFLFNWYDTSDGSVIGDRFVSTVDAGWYAAGLIAARQAFPNLAQRITPLLLGMNFARVYDKSTGQLFGGYDVDKESETTWDYGNLNTESRVADFIAIGKGDVPTSLWWRVYRTLPANWQQLQTPVGPTRLYNGISVFEGHYQLYGVKYVPSWGGSMFESLMPALVLDERNSATHGLGLNDERMVGLQIRYATNTKHYPIWGISPCALPNGGYNAFGVPGLGCSTYDESGVIAPYATFLALSFNPAAALQNLEKMKHRYPIEGKYGFFDSVNVNSKQVTNSYLALDEGMTLVAVDNFLSKKNVNTYFNQDPIAKKPSALLSTEQFSIE